MAQLVWVMDQKIHTLMQLVPGDLQILRNLEQKKTLLLITGIHSNVDRAQILLLICQEEIFLEIQFR